MLLNDVTQYSIYIRIHMYKFSILYVETCELYLGANREILVSKV